jgi:hypothetical protein
MARTEIARRVWTAEGLKLILRPDKQPGDAPGQLAYARLEVEDGILWMWQQTPWEIRAEIIAEAEAEVDSLSSACG